jgi:RNA polymerase sigma-70 factor (sigma-E family)
VPGREDFEEFVAARQAALLRTAYLLTGHRQDAEDLLQVALVKAVPHWHRIQGDPEAYVRRILVRENVSRWRRRRWREVSTDTPADRGAPAGNLPDDVAGRLALRQALLGLAPRQRAVLVLRYLEDLTEAQVAEALGVSVGTVKSQARDGLARLRTMLPAEDASVLVAGRG